MFSPDSQHLAYVSHETSTNWTVVANGHPVKTYESLAEGPIFSPDSQRLAYVIKRGGKCVPVYGECEGKEYDRFLTCDLSRSTGKGRDVWFAGLGFDGRGVLHAVALRGEELLRLELELR